MNLNDLIQKYLDGDLSETEDLTLRSMLQKDEEAREIFNSSVSLHLAMKEDAEDINPPDELIDKTEDMILMKILSDAPEPRKRTFVYPRATVFAAAVALFLALFVFEISDISNVRKVNSTLDQKEKATEDVKKTSGSDGESKIDGGNVEKQASGGSAKISSGIGSATSDRAGGGKKIDKKVESSFGLALAIAPTMEKPKFQDELRYNRAKPIETFAVNTEEKRISQNDLKIKSRKSAKFRLLSDFASLNESSHSDETVELEVGDFYSYGDNVRVASFVGSDLIGGSKGELISNISESVSYAVADEHRIGMEIGYSRLIYNKKTQINVVHSFGGTSGVEALEDEGGFTIGYKAFVQVNEKKDMLWASAFYENSFLKYSNLEFVGRVGLGGSAAGPLGYGRLFARYELLPMLHLTIGAGGRVFAAELPNYLSEDMQFRGAASLIYGIQFNF